MKSIKYFEINSHKRRAGFSMWTLAIAVALSLYGAAAFSPVHAQATTATIFGAAPAGETITVHSTSGTHRHGTANTRGHYNIGPLPLGVYTVTLEKDGKTVDTRSNIPLIAGGGREVDFACAHDQCATSAGSY